MKKAFWYVLGVLCVIMAYIGFVTPGIPFSHFLVGAAFCFAKSSQRAHDWLYNHKWFGPFLTNWNEKRIFPTKAKYGMLVVMGSSLIINWITLQSVPAVAGFAVVCALVAIFTWRYPGSVEEWERRQNG